MRVPREADPIHHAIETYVPALRPAQHRGLVLWVYGAVLAGSACQAAIVLALRPVWVGVTAHAVRQYLREWLYAGADQAAPCATQIEVSACFAPLLRWVLRWWHGEGLPVALDATYQRDRLVVLSVSVLYRGTAIPVAWHVTAANRPGAWREPALDLLNRLAPAVPPDVRGLVLADRGLWSPTVWHGIRAQGWHPLLRIRPDATVRPTGGQRVPARTLVPGPGHAWVGTGVAFKHRAVRQAATLIVVWEAGHADPWLVLTDLAPEAVGPAWYGLRTWVELGCRALKRLGWHWERTRRTDPERVARPWLVLAVATLGGGGDRPPRGGCGTAGPGAGPPVRGDPPTAGAVTAHGQRVCPWPVSAALAPAAHAAAVDPALALAGAVARPPTRPAAPRHRQRMSRPCRYLPLSANVGGGVLSAALRREAGHERVH